MVFVSISSTASVDSVVRGVVSSGCCMVFVSILSDVSFIAGMVVASGGTCVTETLSVTGEGTVVSGVSLDVCRF